MDGRLLPLAVFIAAFVLAPAPATADESGCNAASSISGICGGEVQLRDVATVPGTPTDEDGFVDKVINPVARELTPAEIALAKGISNCGGIEIVTNDPRCAPDPAAAPPPETPPGTPGITLADIASFRPATVTQESEPGGFAVVGLETNFVAAAPTHVVEGTLLGRPASVRFTPVRFGWDYGDGGTRTSDTPGASWAALRLEEFSPTATSHIFEDRGGYTVSMLVGWAAEYRYGTMPGFARIPGTLVTPAAPITLRAGTITTVLVAEDCIQNPDGPGC